MNTHFELLWKSVFAPRAAVDLAGQHPKTSKLMWSYVLVAIVATFVCDVLVIYVLRPFLMTVQESTPTPFPWGETILDLTVLSIFTTVSYVFLLRWFWQGESTKSDSPAATDVAITTAFAWSIVVLLPVYIVAELVFSASDQVNDAFSVALPGAFSVALLGAYLWYFTIFFSHALGMTLKKSFWRNVSFVVFWFLLILLLFTFSAFVSSIMFGTPFGDFFIVQEVTR